jgi:hypothetical protein
VHARKRMRFIENVVSFVALDILCVITMGTCRCS